MSKRYTQEEKEYMAEMAIEIVQKLKIKGSENKRA